MPITRILKVNPKLPEQSILDEAGSVLKAGGLVAFPTETVYGLGANAQDPQAVDRIFAAKGRPASDPLIIHIAHTSDLLHYAPGAPEIALKLAEVFWPGPLTLVLPRSTLIAKNATGGLDTVGIRLPAHPVARLLIQTAQMPIAAPSANLFSHTSPTTAQHVLDDLNGRVDLIIDGGPCPIGVESTVLNLLSNPPEILRPGGISLEELRAYVPDLKLHAGKHPFDSADSAPSPSPGMLLKHYAPRTQLQVLAGHPTAIQQHLNSLGQYAKETHERIGLLLTDELADACAVCHSDTFVLVRLGPGNNLEIVASRLFAAMRSLDQAGVSRMIAVEPENLLDQGGLALAIHDRLVRAASGNLLTL